MSVGVSPPPQSRRPCFVVVDIDLMQMQLSTGQAFVGAFAPQAFDLASARVSELVEPFRMS